MLARFVDYIENEAQHRFLNKHKEKIKECKHLSQKISHLQNLIDRISTIIFRRILLVVFICMITMKKVHLLLINVRSIMIKPWFTKIRKSIRCLVHFLTHLLTLKYFWTKHTMRLIWIQIVMNDGLNKDN